MTTDLQNKWWLSSKVAFLVALLLWTIFLTLEAFQLLPVGSKWYFVKLVQSSFSISACWALISWYGSMSLKTHIRHNRKSHQWFHVTPKINRCLQCTKKHQSKNLVTPQLLPGTYWLQFAPWWIHETKEKSGFMDLARGSLERTDGCWEDCKCDLTDSRAVF